jgi:hypothetical protein
LKNPNDFLQVLPLSRHRSRPLAHLIAGEAQRALGEEEVGGAREGGGEGESILEETACKTAGDIRLRQRPVIK